MKKILIISDTHGHIDEAILHHASEADEVWHGGDWGPGDLSDQLSKLSLVRGVYGNIDGAEIRAQYPLVNRFTTEGVNVLMTHIAGYPGHYNKEARALLSSDIPGIFVCGHSHILKVMRSPDHGRMLHINPGAAGVYGFHKQRTMVRLKLDAGRIFNAEVIDLGARARI